MLRNTLILPETDARLAAQMLRDAVESLDVVLMVVLGKGEDVTRIVRWADQLCNKTQTADSNLRKVVWVRDHSTTTMKEALQDLVGGGALPRVIVLNFFDEVRAKLMPGDPIDPIQLELAFLEGHRG